MKRNQLAFGCMVNFQETTLEVKGLKVRSFNELNAAYNQ